LILIRINEAHIKSLNVLPTVLLRSSQDERAANMGKVWLIQVGYIEGGG
jgi:hypothetical protein